MSNSLYEQLKAGTPAEDIAAAFARELNDAEERIRLEEEEAKRLAQIEAEVLAQNKRADVMSLLDSALYVLSTYYPSFGIKYDDFSDEDLEPLVDLTIALLDLEALKPTKKQFKPVAKIEADAPVEKPTLDDPFASFFKTFGL